MPHFRMQPQRLARTAMQRTTPNATSHRRAHIAQLFCLLLAALSASAGPKPIVLDPAYEHDKWQTSTPDVVRKFEAYTVSFDGNDDDNGDNKSDKWCIPQWVAYEIKRAKRKAPSYSRPAWFTDDGLFGQGIAPRDESYRGAGNTWNRGHMCMKELAARLGKNADHNTHSLLNAVPQADLLNKGIWLDLEKKTGKWADTYGRVWIICGPVFKKKNTPSNWIGEGKELRVAVPDFCFKIVVRESTTPGSPEVLAFEYPNTNSTKELRRKSPFDHTRFQVTVDKVESDTGIDFLTVLDDKAERKVEAGIAPIWP